MVIAVATQKGGTAKTTTSITLSAGLARRGKRCLLVDIDSQANSSKVLIPDYIGLCREQTIYATIIERQPLPVHATRIPGLDIIAAHILLSNSDVDLTVAKDHREERLKLRLDDIKNDYDHVFIDCPPALGWLTINALTAADGVLVIVSPGYFELDSLLQIDHTIHEVRELYNPRLRHLGFLFTKADPTINSRTSLSILRQTYRERVLKTVIPSNTDIRDAHFNKQDIYAYRPQAKAAMAYDKLIDELFYEKAT